MHEFWPDLQHTQLAPDDPQLQAEFSKILPASCARLLPGSRICYIRVDEVGGGVGGWVATLRRMHLMQSAAASCC